MFFFLLAFLVVQRLGELLLARSNERYMKSRGACEVGREHYKWIVLLHTGWFISMIVEYFYTHPAPHPWWPALLGIFILMQGMRYTIIATLGRFWNTRILILPGTKPVRRGIYRYIRHPNYWIVRVELLIIPLLFQLYITAIVFTILNAFMLRVRIRAEEQALAMLEASPEEGD